MRRERDKYQDKFDHIKEDMQEIKRQRDPYQQKLERTNQLDGRSSPAFKRSDEYLNKRPTSGALYRDSHSPDGLSKKDSRYSIKVPLNFADVSPLDLVLQLIHRRIYGKRIGQSLIELA